jgi:hypothetical protein
VLQHLDAPVPTVNAWGKGPPRIQDGARDVPTPHESRNPHDSSTSSSFSSLYEDPFTKKVREPLGVGGLGGSASVPTTANSSVYTASDAGSIKSGSLTPPNMITPSVSGGNR